MPSSPPTRSPLALTAVLAAAAALWTSCGNPDPRTAGVRVDSDGVTLRVTEGPLAGLVLVLPAAARADAARIRVATGKATELGDATPVGPAALLGPSGLAFDPAATLTLPFESALLPAGAAAADLVVRRRDSRGRVTALEPSSVDAKQSTVTVPVTRLSTFWVAAPADAESAGPSLDYFPLDNGDFYEFDSGLTLTILATDSAPNLRGIPLRRARFELGLDDFGCYLGADADATVLRFGGVSISQDVQEVLDDPTVFLPTDASLGATASSASALLGYSPIGTTTPGFDGRESVTTTVVSQGRLSTPLGVFDDVIEVLIETEGRAGSATRSLSDRLWLARGVGPVQVSLDGVPLSRLVGATVGGARVE